MTDKEELNELDTQQSENSSVFEPQEKPDQSVQQKLDKIREDSERVRRVTQRLTDIVNNVIQLLLNPYTWLTIITILILITLKSCTDVVGQSDFNTECSSNGMASVGVGDSADDFTRQSAIASWLTSTPFKSNDDKPMTKEQAAGVIGNMIQESGSKPGAVQNVSSGNPDYYKTCDNSCVEGFGSVGGKAVGLAQWDSGRRVALVKFAQGKGKPWHDLNVQLEYLKQELDGGEGSGLKTGGFFSPTNDAETSAWLWNKLFERSADTEGSPAMLNRKNSAKEFVTKYKGGGSFSTNCTGGSVDTSNVVALAVSTAYKPGDNRANKKCSQDAHCGEDIALPGYIAAKKVAEEKGGKDSLTQLFSSCDRFVATILKATEVDKEFPWGSTVEQAAYLEKQTTKWKKINCADRQPGDVLMVPGKHIMLYLGIVDGKDTLASASHRERSAQLNGVSCNGSYFNADSYPDAQGWRRIK